MERIDILDERGVPNGRMRTRHEVHRDGDWHRAVHVWLSNARGEVLIQKRSKAIDLFPDQWDVSLAGHLRSGEESRDAARRELKEELGVDAKRNELELLGAVRSELRDGANLENQFIDVYVFLRPVEADVVERQKSEVDEIEFVSPEKLHELIREHLRRFIPRREEYELMLRFFSRTQEKTAP